MTIGDITLLNTLEFETTNVCYDAEDIIHVAGNVYLIAYSYVNGLRTGQLLTVTIEPNGDIGSVIDTLEYEADIGYYANLANIPDTDKFIIAYTGPGTDGWIKTFAVDNDGYFNSIIAEWEFDPVGATYPQLYHLGGTVWLLVHDQDLQTFNINANGTFGANIASKSGVGSAFTNLVNVAGDVFAIAYTNAADSDGYLRTWVIESDGTIAAAQVDFLEWETTYGYDPCISHISGNVFAINYQKTGIGGPGRMITLPIADNGTLGDIGSIIDSFQYTANGLPTGLVHVSGEIYIFGYVGAAGIGKLATVTISDAGQIEEPLLNEVQYGVTPSRCRIIEIAAKVFAFVYRESDNDYGVLKTFSIEYVTSPTVQTNPATLVATNSATLNGPLDADGGEACDCGFEWGETIAYGNTTPTQSRTTGQTFAQTITGLDPSTTYHFRAFATNSVGTSYGSDRSFTTPAVPVVARIKGNPIIDQRIYQHVERIPIGIR